MVGKRWRVFRNLHQQQFHHACCQRQFTDKRRESILQVPRRLSVVGTIFGLRKRQRERTCHWRNRLYRLAGMARTFEQNRSQRYQDACFLSEQRFVWNWRNSHSHYSCSSGRTCTGIYRKRFDSITSGMDRSLQRRRYEIYIQDYAGDDSERIFAYQSVTASRTNSQWPAYPYVRCCSSICH